MCRSLFRPLIVVFLLTLCAPVFAGSSILVFGDSLSAGYGLVREQAWPALLEKRLVRENRDYTVVNASISGETTAGGRSRFADALARHKPSVVIIELGANDGLRGLPVASMKENLLSMVKAAKAARAKVLLVGMKLPPNYGPDYLKQFEAAFQEIATKEKTALLPFLLEPVAAEGTNFQADGLHPIAAAEPAILDHVWKALKPLL